jgi:hypothetical protein
MSLMSSALSRPKNRSIGVAAFVVAVVALAVIGAVSGVNATLNNPTGLLNSQGTIAIGSPAKTGFGWVVVTHVDKIAGLSDQALSGATHGIQNLVPAGQQQIQVTLQLASAQPKDVAAYSPDQFRLFVGKDPRGVAPTTSTIMQGTLQPFAEVEGHLGFIVPTDGSALTLHFADPSQSGPVVLDLGTIGPATTTHP